MITILVTGAGGGVGQGIIKSLRLITDLNIKIIAADMSNTAAGFYGADYCYLLPSASDKTYIDEISRICKKNSVDYYFPGTDVELLLCAKEAGVINTKLGVKIIVSPLDLIEIADDKYKTVSFLKQNNFHHPITWLPDEVDLNSITYPVIVKPRIGCRSIGVYVVNSAQEALSAIEGLVNPIVQEYIDGDEFTCTVAIRHGVVSDVLCLRRDLRAGDTYRAFPVKDSVIEEYVRNIALTLGVDGSCNFQLRTSNGIPKLFEINSRFSGTTPFCSYLGFNPVEFCIKQDLEISYRSNIAYDKVILRHWSEVIIDQSELDVIVDKKEGAIQSFTVTSMI